MFTTGNILIFSCFVLMVLSWLIEMPEYRKDQILQRYPNLPSWFLWIWCPSLPKHRTKQIECPQCKSLYPEFYFTKSGICNHCNYQNTYKESISPPTVATDNPNKSTGSIPNHPTYIYPKPINEPKSNPKNQSKNPLEHAPQTKS